MAAPALLPAEARPLDAPSKKRKHDELVDSVPNGIGADVKHDSPGSDQSNEDHDDDDDDDDGSVENEDFESESLIEDLVDHAEIDPFIPDGNMDIMSDETANRLRNKLRRDGVERFFDDIMVAGQMEPRTVGIAFGLDPNLNISDDAYLRLLGIVVMRFFYKRQKLKQYNTIDDAAQLLLKSKKIICITGAGISTSLGIPDFRSKGTGFYDKLREQGFIDPQEVFEINAFKAEPEKFYNLAGELLPDKSRYSPTHAFIRLLQDKNRLLTNYTQNIDNMEQNAGIDKAKYIQCHGSFATASCLKCQTKVPGEDIFDDLRAKQVAYCKVCVARLNQEGKQGKKRSTSSYHPQKRSKVNAYADDDDDTDADYNHLHEIVMKPDIIFFGEQLPSTFFERLTRSDAQQADLVLVIGTSLKVAPVSEMPNYLPHHVPHVYISLEPVRHVAFDVQLLGNCDDVVAELCRRAGWRLTHGMLPSPFVADVQKAQGEDAHVWRVTRAEPACLSQL